MFREMRRKDKMRTEEDSIRMLSETGVGVLCLHGDDGYPYGVPLNHTYMDGRLYFHCAKEGHKIDAIKRDQKASYTVIGGENVDTQAITTVYKSVICFGRVHIVESDEEKRRALEKVIERFVPDNYEKGMDHIDAKWKATEVIAFEIEHMTGKGKAE